MKSAFFKHHYRVRATHGDTLGSEYGKKIKRACTASKEAYRETEPHWRSSGIVVYNLDT